MYLVSTAPSDPDPVTLPEGNTYGIPCVFKGCQGFYHSAGGATGVVLCSPWGFEDLSMRKGWRLLAEAIAKAGYPCLRFDYPGTGNSLGAATDVASVEEWIASIDHAADFLRLASGVRRFVFIGQSLGGTLAVEAARRRTDVAALQLIAPIVKGRAYVRELAATATLVADKIGIRLEPVAQEALSVLGFSLSPSMVESLKSLDLCKIEGLAVPRLTIFDQAARKAGAEAIEHFRRLGSIAAFVAIEPFHIMVSDATAIQPLPVSTEAIVACLADAGPMRPAPQMPLPAIPAALIGAGYREEPIRFGADQAFFGILCRPAREQIGAPAFILLNRGLNAHIGWRRASVDQARGLAAAGFTSLRIDVAGIGESRDEPGRPPNLIYSDLLVPDIRAAVDVLASRGLSRIVLSGVCSGAYEALITAHADPRVTHVVAVNAQRFVWNPAETHDDVIRYGLRSVSDYLGDMRSGRAIRKLVARRHRILPATRFLMRRYIKDALVRVPLKWRSRLLRNSMAARVYGFFEEMEAKGTRVSLVFSAGDPGLMELRNYFGPGGRDLPFANVTVTIVPDADHNLTTTRATTFMLDHMIELGRETSPRDAARPPQRPVIAQSRAVCPT